jgi:hypothetical protein
MEKQIVEEVTRLEAEMKPLCLTQTQFLEIIDKIPQKHNDLQTVEETAAGKISVLQLPILAWNRIMIIVYKI